MHVIQFLIHRDFISWLLFPQYHHSPVTVMLKQVQFVASQCVGAQGGQDTQEITVHEGNSSLQSRMKKWTQGMLLQHTPMPRCAAGQL